MNKKVLISLHDVTPYHLPRILKAEKLLREWGVKKISYFFIPDYHQTHEMLNKQILIDFKEWIKKKKNATVEWVLHGYYHMDTKTPTSNRKTFIQNLKQKLPNSNEAEFFDLSSEEISNRIQKGKEIFYNHFKHDPTVFVSPAWLFNEHLISCLKLQNFNMTEDHSYIYILKQNKKISVPVITWATRTFPLKFSSQIGCPILNWIWSFKNLIRIAIHPFDFDFSSTVRSVKGVIKQVLKQRHTILYRELQ